MAKLILGAVGAANLAVAFSAAAYMLAADDLTLDGCLVILLTLTGAGLATCALESLDPFEQPFGDVANLPETPFHNRDT